MMRVTMLAVLLVIFPAAPFQMEWGYSSTGWSFSGPTFRDVPEHHQFVFARLAYPGCGLYVGKGWDIDFPKADRQLVMGLKRLMVLDAYSKERAVRLEQNEINRFPFIYIVEPSFMCITDAHADELRQYLERGGFIFADDFWGTVEWERVVDGFRKVLPAAHLRRIPLSHPLFHQVYDIDEIIQVPNVGQGMQGGPTWEADGYTPEVWGFFDDDDRLLVLMTHNTDLGDAWEWAENPYYPLKYSNYAYRMAVNAVAYAMSH
jgi:hypothetical protein